MQTIEKALHAPMPFTTGGQTISDRLTAAKHSLAGSQLGKTICKATTEELMAPKKKHLDYLLHCTNEPNVSIPSMANLLIERTQHPSWTIVYKALITIHNIMCYGNERFSQYLASCNTTFNLGNFLDKNTTSGYDMSQHVRRYGKYIGEKIATYRVCAFDFCKVKRGREDGLLRTMHTDKLLKTLPILQNQIDALLEFQVSSSELNNGVINCSFILLFRDLIRLFACYNDGIINLLEKYFDMNKKQCREALDTYKGFLTRLDKVSEFLRVAESVGIDRGEIPDLTRAPASLLEALEAHLIHLEGGRPPPPTQQHQAAMSQVNNFSITGGFQAVPQVGDAERMRHIEMEKERLRQFEQMKQQNQGAPSQFNPFAADSAAAQPAPNNDLLDFFNAPAQAPAMDATNPFAQFSQAPPPQQQQAAPAYNQVAAGQNAASVGMYANQPNMLLMTSSHSAAPSYSNGNGTANTTANGSNGFSADFQRAFAPPTTSGAGGSSSLNGLGSFDPFAQQKMGGDIDSALAGLADNLSIGAKPQQSQPVPWGGQSGMGGAPPARPPAPVTSSGAMPMGQQYGGQYGGQQSFMGGQPQMQWGMQQQPGMYGGMPQQAQMQQPGYGMYGQQPAQMGYGGMGQQMPQQQMHQQPPQQQPSDPFSGF